MDDAANKITERMMTDLESRLYVEYAQAEQEIRKRALEHFEQYTKDYKQWEKDVAAGKKTERQFKKWRMTELAQGERWNALREQIAEDLYHVDGIARSITEGYMPEVYAVNHNYGIYQIEQNADIQTSLTLYDRATVERLMRDDPELLPPPGKKVAQAIAEKKALRWSRQRLQSVMTQGILQGESIPRLADRLAREIGESNRKAAVRNARTMATNAQNAGRYDAYKRASDNGIPLTIEWQATLDLRTRHSHRQLHGQRREVGEPFEVDNIKILYPAQLRGAQSNIPQEMIWNCRCTLLAWVKGYEGQTVKKTKRMDGMSFEEWQDSHLNDNEYDVSANTESQKIVKLIGGNGDPEITDNPKDYFIPAATRGRLSEIGQLRSYDDFEKYLYEKYRIELDTGLQKLKSERRYDEISAVKDECEKITVAIDAYIETFGGSALSSLHKIVLYDKSLDVDAAYFFNRIGENDPLAGEIHFSQWNDSGRTIFHELAHAFQDSNKAAGEDAVSFSERIVRELHAENLKAYTGASSEDYAAEQFADAFGFGFSLGIEEDISFITQVQKLLKGQKTYGH